MGLFNRRRTETSAPTDALEERPFEGGVEYLQRGKRVAVAFTGDGDFETPVVGLFYHEAGQRDFLLSIQDGFANGWGEFTAQLVREPQNDYDSNAIAVLLAGWLVGYVPAEIAAKMARVLDGYGRGILMRCPALVWWSPTEWEVRKISLDIGYDPAIRARHDELDRLAIELDAEAARRLSSGSITPLFGTGRFRIDVEGESRYLAHLGGCILRSSGAQSLGTGRVAVYEGTLLPHADGIRVMVEGAAVGWVPRSTLPEMVQAAQRAWDGGRVATAQAQTWATEEYASVRLDVADAATMLPVNALPAEPYAVLPFGRRLQVTGEEQHLDVLIPLLDGAAERSAWATLHAVDAGGRTPRVVVEVRIDGQAVGRLTPATSAEFLPTIEAVAKAGRVLVVRSALKGNTLKVETTINAAKAADVPAGWIRQATYPATESP